MAQPKNSSRFQVNPVEIAIFSLVSLIFCKSVYDLFQDRANFKMAALAPMASQPTLALRNPASVTAPDFLNMDLNCESTGDQETVAGKLRLTGNLCGKGSQMASKTNSPLVKTQISNSANRFAATVFTDMTTGKFSTDYIPLIPGKNTIQVEFTWLSDKFVQQFTIINKEVPAKTSTQ